MTITPDDILKALSRVKAPGSGKDIVAADMVRAPHAVDGHARFILEVAPELAPHMEPVLKAAEAIVAALPGISQVTGILTAHGPAPAPRPKGPPPSLKIGGHPKPQASKKIWRGSTMR